jgi:G3E family GTPase
MVRRSKAARFAQFLDRLSEALVTIFWRSKAFFWCFADHFKR